METEIASLLERGITGGIFALLYWRERNKVSQVQDARIADLHTWLQVLARLNISPTMDNLPD